MLPVPSRLPALFDGIEFHPDIQGAPAGGTPLMRRRASVPGSGNPSDIPPACSSRISRMVVPMGSSHAPGLLDPPADPVKSLCRCLHCRSGPRNQAAPLLMIWGMLEIVSHVVEGGWAWPHKPTNGAGKGGFWCAGSAAGLPSEFSRGGFSSPQI